MWAADSPAPSSGQFPCPTDKQNLKVNKPTMKPVTNPPVYLKSPLLWDFSVLQFISGEQQDYQVEHACHMWN